MKGSAVAEDTEIADIAGGPGSASHAEDAVGIADTACMLAVDIVALENRDLD